ncbi:MAG: B12-binding domain-containing radical SAM protein, partial [Deltaproteobacteria bacterium]
MKILLIYPKYPDTFWSFKYALKFISKKASFPPLGLLTVAAMLPSHWQKRLVDMNVRPLSDEALQWADYVFISAMAVQKESAIEVINRCKRMGIKTAAGGPLFTAEYEEFKDVDHLILNEAEKTLPPFLEDLRKGSARHIYTTSEWPDLKQTPPPLWELIEMKEYASMNIQYSRGCPFNCEFCDIIVLNGRIPRTKDKEQIILELNSLYDHGWRGGVFFVDDNFIGNKKKLKAQILPAIIGWMKERNYPFSFFTEASIDLSDDEELMGLMVEAGFDTVFIGIETPYEESLTECSKFQNRNRDLVACVKKIQQRGLQVTGGFIVGFDHDPPSIFERQINFIQKSGIVTAMVGLLNAPRGTRLYRRLRKENRLLHEVSGDNTDCSINFIPKMGHETLINGYKRIMKTIYSPRHYYRRIGTFLHEYRPSNKQPSSFHFAYL